MNQEGANLRKLIAVSNFSE